MHQMMKYENRRDCPVTKTKYRVVTDEQLAFMLYKGELSHYRLKKMVNYQQKFSRKSSGKFW